MYILSAGLAGKGIHYDYYGILIQCKDSRDDDLVFHYFFRWPSAHDQIQIIQQVGQYILTFFNKMNVKPIEFKIDVKEIGESFKLKYSYKTYGKNKPTMFELRTNRFMDRMMMIVAWSLTITFACLLPFVGGFFGEAAGMMTLFFGIVTLCTALLSILFTRAYRNTNAKISNFVEDQEKRNIA